MVSNIGKLIGTTFEEWYEGQLILVHFSCKPQNARLFPFSSFITEHYFRKRFQCPHQTSFGTHKWGVPSTGYSLVFPIRSGWRSVAFISRSLDSLTVNSWQ
eukprot:TRINITY_DN18182_c0_g1_i1.p1 TRINITY_DN18182_c0_g1~~TRINITY_DN18182_c0_g1_i1.p1  ORF type:complete len:101 (+),score=4.94 TRINITY_DN18182_c0_g1_i1:494-796(+)